MRKVLPCLLMVLCSASFAADLKVDAVWIRGTVAAQKVTGAFMTLTSPDDAVLLGAECPLAGKTELHEMRMQNSVMKMQEIARIPLPAGKTVQLKPSGFHLMLFDLKRPLKAGEHVPLNLKIEHAGKQESVSVDAEVKPLDEAAHEHAAH